MFVADYAGGFQNPFFNAKNANNSYYKDINTQTEQNQNQNEAGYELHRQTFGITILEMMDNEEYSNFRRVTEYESNSNKYEFAQSIENLASDYLKKENIIEDETITKAIQTQNATFEEVKYNYDSIGGMKTIFEQELGRYIDKIKSMVGGNYHDLIKFMSDFSNSLKYSQIDLQA
jgi:hypothetical protein